MRSCRSGFVLLPILLLLLGSVAMVLGVAEVAHQLRLSTATWTETLQADAAAVGGLRLTSLTHPGLPGLVLGDTLTLLRRGWSNGEIVRVRARRVSDEVYIMEGTGEVSPSPVTKSLGRAAWRPDPVVRTAVAPAVVQAGGVVHVRAPGRLDPSTWGQRPSGWPAGTCALHLAALAGFGLVPIAASQALGTLQPELGPLDLAALRRMTVPFRPGTYVPLPRVQGGTCRMVPSNWGSPSDPLGPCGSSFVSGGATGSVTLQGGEGQGLLVVEGDLTLTSGVWFSGVVLVGGTLRVQSGARLDGFALVGADVVISGGGRVLGSGCAAIRALGGATGSWGAVYLPDGGWIDPF